MGATVPEQIENVKTTQENKLFYGVRILKNTVREGEPLHQTRPFKNGLADCEAGVKKMASHELLRRLGQL